MQEQIIIYHERGIVFYKLSIIIIGFSLLLFVHIFCFVAVMSTILSCRSLIHSSASVILLLIPSSVLSWRRKWQPTPVFLPRESHGWRSLVGCSRWGGTELDTTEATQQQQQQQQCTAHLYLFVL